MSANTVETPSTPALRAAAGAGRYLDARLGLARVAKVGLRKVFPDHWSFMLGEIALYSFIVLLITGTFLTFFFNPSMTEVVYQGSYVPLKGVPMSEAMNSTMNISFDVRGGLLMRQIHHWAALMFLAAIAVHMMRVFFTGAFRKPREFNWIIGVNLFILGILEGFAGYSLPDDLLSGNGLRIAEGITRSIPVVGSYASFLLFGGEFPGTAFIPRLYIIHVLLLPGIILALITAHLIMVVFHKHTHYPGPGRTNRNVVGYPLMPVYMAKAGGFFFLVFGVLALLGAFVSINPIWNYGPYNPSPVSAGSQPDWYMAFLDGALRLMPGWETHIFGVTISWNVFVPAAVFPGILFTALMFYPFLEAWITGDRREHHLADRPRNAPTRTGLGVAGIVLYTLLMIAGGNDVIATQFHLSINAMTQSLRVLVFVVPVIAFIITRRICLGLQRRDRETVLHGSESGTIVQTPTGEFLEIHTPTTAGQNFALTSYDSPEATQLPSETDAHGVRRPGVRALSRLRTRLNRFYFGDRVTPVTPAEQAQSHHNEHEESVAINQPETPHQPELTTKP